MGDSRKPLWGILNIPQKKYNKPNKGPFQLVNEFDQFPRLLTAVNNPWTKEFSRYQLLREMAVQVKKYIDYMRRNTWLISLLFS